VFPPTSNLNKLDESELALYRNENLDDIADEDEIMDDEDEDDAAQRMRNLLRQEMGSSYRSDDMDEEDQEE